MISTRFLLEILALNKNRVVIRIRTGSHKINSLDIFKNSPCYFYKKCVGAANENLILILEFTGLNVASNKLILFQGKVLVKE